MKQNRLKQTETTYSFCFSLFYLSRFQFILFSLCAPYAYNGSALAPLKTIARKGSHSPIRSLSLR